MSDPATIAKWRLILSIAKIGGQAAASAARGLIRNGKDCPDATAAPGPTPCQKKALDRMIGQWQENNR